MRIALTSQENRFRDYLREFKRRELSLPARPCEPVVLRQRICPCTKPLSSFDFSFLFRYQIFPENILTFFGEWELDGREMRQGDTIVQQAYLPPVRWGLKLIFAVRVINLVKTDFRIGFQYGTVEGHPECGTNEFTFSLDDGSLCAAVRTASRPGVLLTRAFPFLMRPYIGFSNRKALATMEQEFVRFNFGERKALKQLELKRFSYKL